MKKTKATGVPRDSDVRGERRFDINPKHKYDTDYCYLKKKNALVVTVIVKDDLCLQLQSVWKKT